MQYVPSPIPNDAPRGLKSWLVIELRRISSALRSFDHLPLAILGNEPARPFDGMIVYADGTSWNPGSGAGFYGYESGAWVKL